MNSTALLYLERQNVILAAALHTFCMQFSRQPIPTQIQMDVRETRAHRVCSASFSLGEKEIGSESCKGVATIWPRIVFDQREDMWNWFGPQFNLGSRRRHPAAAHHQKLVFFFVRPLVEAGGQIPSVSFLGPADLTLMLSAGISAPLQFPLIACWCVFGRVRKINERAAHRLSD